MSGVEVERVARLATVGIVSKPEAALQYAGLGWPVFPLHTLDEQGRGTCGRGCLNPGKYPIDMPQHPETVLYRYLYCTVFVFILYIIRGKMSEIYGHIC